MGREAELFVAAEGMLVEVIGRIREEQWPIVLPPVLDADRPATLETVVARHAAEDAGVPDLLAGRPPADPDPDLSAADVPRLAAAACAAARELDDGTAADLLWRLTMIRAFRAHDIAMALGSRACPLPEDLARGLLEATAPRAGHWRAAGLFREPLPFPPGHVSWRDQFLLTAGRDPHPFLD
jgi:hypothetical protein